MVIVASLADSGGVAECVAGADAGILPVSESGSGAKSIKDVLQAVPDIPWGGWLKDAGSIEMPQLMKAGCDFVVFPATSAALTMLQDDGVGKILELEPSLSDGLLSAVNELPVDAVLINGGQGQFLTWHHLMRFQHCADVLTKPLLASIPLRVTGSELQAVWAAGVGGVVVGVGTEPSAGGLAELRQAVDKLTLPSPRKRGKPAALVPKVDGRAATITGESEEE
jgi:hypothetical protein